MTSPARAAPGWLVALAAFVALATAAAVSVGASVQQLKREREDRLLATGEVLLASLRGLDPFLLDPVDLDQAEAHLRRVAGALGLRDATVVDQDARVLASSSPLARPGDLEPALLSSPEAAERAWAGQAQLGEVFALEGVASQAAFTPWHDPEGGVASLIVTVAGRDAFQRLDHLQAIHRAALLVTTLTVALLGLSALRLSRRRAQAEAELLHSQRLAAAGQVAAGVVHELRNPLGILRSTIEFLRDQLADPAHAALAGEAMEEADRIEEALGRFLALARAGPAEPRALRVGDEAAAVARLVAPDLERRGLLVDTHGLDAEAWVNADPRGLRQALLNLVLNARQALDGRSQSGPGLVVLRLEEQAAEVALVVEDDGPGYPPEVLAEPFQAFRTGRPEGTGLGLPLVDRFARDAGGRLEIENRPNGGARARLRLPRCQPPEDAAEAPPEAAAPPAPPTPEEP